MIELWIMLTALFIGAGVGYRIRIDHAKQIERRKQIKASQEASKAQEQKPLYEILTRAMKTVEESYREIYPDFDQQHPPACKCGYCTIKYGPEGKPGAPDGLEVVGFSGPGSYHPNYVNALKDNIEGLKKDLRVTQAAREAACDELARYRKAIPEVPKLQPGERIEFTHNGLTYLVSNDDQKVHFPNTSYQTREMFVEKLREGAW